MAMKDLKIFTHVICAVFVALFFSTAPAHASGTHYSMTLGNWELNLIRDSNGDFMGFWAIPHEQLSVGNIRRMWLEPVGVDDWAVYAHEPVNSDVFLDALITDGLSDDSRFHFLWRETKAKATFLTDNIDGGAEGSVSKGFISGDPLSETAGAMADPTPMIDLLADVNYPVAPGMTELMVNGTAGASVDMNQATKQLLNCLRSVGPNGCGACVCTMSDPTFSPGTWTLNESENGPQSLNCYYTRQVVVSVTYTGEYSNCTDCSRTETDSYIENHEILGFIGDACPTSLDANGDPTTP